MKKLFVCMLVLMTASTCNTASTQADFNLSPNGSDAWSGALSRGRELARTKDADTAYNIYYCANNRESGERMLKKQQSDGVDAHSVAVDPLFVDPEHGDFTFKPESPALKIGIIPIDLSKVGLRTAKD